MPKPRPGAVQRDGMTFVCELPAALGSVTKLEMKNGSVVARTASGITFIVPIHKDR